MQVRMLNNYVGVEQVGKTSKKDGMFAEVETTNNLGKIKFVGEEADKRFQVGQKVYFGNKREEIRMSDADVLIMEDSNIYAIVEDVQDEKEEAS